MAEQVYGLSRDAYTRTREVVRRVESSPIGGPGYRAKVRDHRPIARGDIFPVVMTQTGGGAGDDATQCSYTYTVEDAAGNELATVVDPSATPSVWRRDDLGAYNPATAGEARWEMVADVRTLSIRWCNEARAVDACDAESS